MSLQFIRATFECDGCGKPFLVEMDAAATTPPGWTLFELAVDDVRGGIDFYGFVGAPRTQKIIGFTSVQAGMCLCPICTNKVDEHVTEDREATETEVNEATAP